MADNVVDIESQLPDDGTAWWCKLLAKAIGIFAAIVCGICGTVRVVTISPLCLAAGIIMFVIAFIMLLFEAPICCVFFETTKGVSGWIEKRRYWHKGLFYVLISVAPFAMCPSISTFLGCICPFAAGVIYGLMSLGRKGNREEMMSNVNHSTSLPLSTQTTNKFHKFKNEPE